MPLVATQRAPRASVSDGGPSLLQWGVPSVWTQALTSATAALDQGVKRAVARRLRPHGRTLPADARSRLLAVANRYTTEALFSQRPGVPQVERVSAGRGPAGSRQWDVAFASEYRAVDPAYRDELLRYRENLTVHARLYTAAGCGDAGTNGRPSSQPALPAIITLHGWGAGPYWMSERALDVGGWLDAGFDVAAMQLPLHGRRTPGGRGPSGALVIGANVARTNEVIGQAISDVRALAAYLVNAGAPAVAVIGMSLGGYLSALWARLDDHLRFVVALVPAAELGALLWGGTEDVNFQREALRNGIDRSLLSEALVAHSPLAGPSRLPRHALAVIGATGDRITGPEQAELLAGHWGIAPEWIAGGHLAQTGRTRALTKVRARLRQAGLLPNLSAPPSVGAA